MKKFLIALALVLVGSVVLAQYRPAPPPSLVNYLKNGMNVLTGSLTLSRVSGTNTSTVTSTGGNANLRVSTTGTGYSTVVVGANSVQVQSNNNAGETSVITASKTGGTLEFQASSISANGSTYVKQDPLYGALRLTHSDGAVKPACNSSSRGYQWRTAGGAGVADTLEICRKDNLDAYAWVALF